MYLRISLNVNPEESTLEQCWLYSKLQTVCLCEKNSKALWILVVSHQIIWGKCKSEHYFDGFVTESKLVLLAARQASNRETSCWASAPKNHLAWVRIQAHFILKGEGVKSNLFWFPSASGGDVLISSSLQSFTDGPDQNVSCELNKAILA